MIKTSAEYRKAVLVNRKFLVKLDITLNNGERLPTVENNLLMSEGVRFDDAVSSAGTLNVGAAIINQCTILLNNADERFSNYDFRGAIVQAKIGLQLSNTVEWIDKGTYYVESAKTTGVAIAITALDNMLLFDKSYSESKLEYPASLLEIYRDACTECGVEMGNTHFTNDNYVVKSRPNDEALTYREVVSYVAQIACCFARINNAGALEIRWYDHKSMENEADLWGGNNIDYTTGDSAYGGNFSNYSTGDNCYGGDFISHYSFHHFYRLLSHNIATDDIVVTGVRVIEEKADNELEKPAEYFVGAEGYVIEFKNALIQPSEGKVIANLVGNELMGFRFRPLSISVQYDPSIEAGDCAYVTDRKMNVYRTIVSSVSGGVGDQQTIKADAETPVENTSTRYSQSTKNYLDARIAAKQEVNRYDSNVQKLNEIMSNSLGFYTTYEVQEDGSKIKYMHDKLLLSDSQTIYKQTIDAYAVSTNGGVTWNYGHTRDGNIIAQTLSAIGINADWLTVGGYNNADGVITVKDANGSQFIRIGKDGILMSNGAKLMGGNGVLSNIQVDSIDERGSTGFRFLGYSYSISGIQISKPSLFLWVNIPDGFIISEACVTLYMSPFFYTSTYLNISGTGYPRNIRLYYATSMEGFRWAGSINSEYEAIDSNAYEEISNAFGSAGATGSSSKMVSKKSANVAQKMRSGLNLIRITTAETAPTTAKDTCDRCGVGKAVINVIGYMS